METNEEIIEIVQTLLNLGRQYGPVGIVRTLTEQEHIASIAEELNVKLQSLSLQGSSKTTNNNNNNNPANKQLIGQHNLVYSAAPGGSSGKIGPFTGTVTQQFITNTTFINKVQIGPLQISLTAERLIKNSHCLTVTFKSTSVSLLLNNNIQIFKKDISGGGTWEYIYANTIIDKYDNNTKKFIRIMKTPSLFILEQPI